MATAVPTASPQATGVIVYGAAWCEDTRRARRLLRRLGVPHRYCDVDEDLDALDRATALNDGLRRTPVIEMPGRVLVEPANEALTHALLSRKILSRTEVDDRLQLQNVGDVERGLRVVAGLTMLAATKQAPRTLRGLMRLVGAGLLVSGAAGWCPVYQTARVSSLNGPGDRPDEAERPAWLKLARQRPARDRKAATLAADGRPEAPASTAD
jgi:glutaredoxin